MHPDAQAVADLLREFLVLCDGWGIGFLGIEMRKDHQVNQESPSVSGIAFLGTHQLWKLGSE